MYLIVSFINEGFESANFCYKWYSSCFCYRL